MTETTIDPQMIDALQTTQRALEKEQAELPELLRQAKLQGSEEELTRLTQRQGVLPMLVLRAKRDVLQARLAEKQQAAQDVEAQLPALSEKRLAAQDAYNRAKAAWDAARNAHLAAMKRHDLQTEAMHYIRNDIAAVERELAAI